jgi:hypothetical protein
VVHPLRCGSLRHELPVLGCEAPVAEPEHAIALHRAAPGGRRISLLPAPLGVGAAANDPSSGVLALACAAAGRPPGASALDKVRPLIAGLNPRGYAGDSGEILRRPLRRITIESVPLSTSGRVEQSCGRYFSVLSWSAL